MADYRFLTTWCLDAPIQPAWEAIHASERWPEWWQGVERVTEVAAFARNHDGVMRQGGRGLARLLGARLLVEG